MIKRTFLYASLITIAALFLIMFNLTYIKKSDYLEYENISKQISNINHLKSHDAYQKREDVQKDIWTMQDNSRRLYRISSKSSELFLTQKKEKINLFEILQNIECLLQDKIEFNKPIPMQNLRHFTAKTGIYNFSKQTFNADDLTLSLYQIPFKTEFLQIFYEIPYLTGTADHLNFSLLDKKPQFKAQNLQARFVSGEKECD